MVLVLYPKIRQKVVTSLFQMVELLTQFEFIGVHYVHQ
jgi:hypothetical protein